MSANDKAPPCLLSALRLPKTDTQTSHYENLEEEKVKLVAVRGRKSVDVSV